MGLLLGAGLLIPPPSRPKVSPRSPIGRPSVRLWAGVRRLTPSAGSSMTPDRGGSPGAAAPPAHMCSSYQRYRLEFKPGVHIAVRASEDSARM